METKTKNIDTISVTPAFLWDIYTHILPDKSKREYQKISMCEDLSPQAQEYFPYGHKCLICGSVLEDIIRHIINSKRKENLKNLARDVRYGEILLKEEEKSHKGRK